MVREGVVTSARFSHSIRFIAGRFLPPRWSLALLFVSSLLAVNPNLSIDQYLHTSWTQEEGNPLPPILALAQTEDGYLWLGAGHGLIRFDGMRFVEWSPISGPLLPNSKISCLRAASGGGLWVGTMAGLCRVDHGHVIRYPALDKLPCGLIISLLEDRARGLWILNSCKSGNTLALLSSDGSVKTFGAADGLPEEQPLALVEDRQGQLWIGTGKAVCRWAPGSRAVCSNGPEVSVLSIAEAQDGQLVIADGSRNQGFLFAHGAVTPLGPKMPDAEFIRAAMVRDRDGNVWIGTTGQGLIRLHDNRVDRYSHSEGLSSNSVNSLLEDHEGNLWVATAHGIDRIRDPKLQLFSTLNGLSSDLVNAVTEGHDGVIWIGTAGGLDRFVGSRESSIVAAGGLPSPAVLALSEDARNHLWVGTTSGLAVQSGDRFREVLTAGGQHLYRVFNIAGEPGGTVWLSDSRRGLFMVRGGVADPVSLGTVEGGDIYGLLAARNGDVWLGYFQGGVTVLRKGVTRRYDARDGLAGGPVHAFYEDDQGAIWVGSGEGLSRFRDGRWTSWTAAQGLPEGGVQSIVGEGSDGLWLMTSTGVLRLSRGSLDNAAKPVTYVLFGRAEGLRLATSSASPRLARSRDGRLWVCTEDGLAVIDLSRVRSNPIAPPVVIEQVVADGKVLDPAFRGEAAFRGHDLEITYTGISLMAPDAVRFRYQLAPLERKTVDAGTRRNVTYANLAPGEYRFEVSASNNDGLWNPDGAGLKLRVDPYFYQTTWFRVACVLSLGLVVWSIYQLNLRRAVAQLRLIAAERVRFSRELHDSLLQGFSGVVYLLEAAARQFESDPAVSKQRLDKALDQADQSLREARQMIVSMRIPALETNTLPEALKATIAQMMEGSEVDYQFDLKGRVRHGPFNVEANLFLIAREAITNALNHAAATWIRLELSYTAKELHLIVQDDGKGFDPAMAQTKDGHWGFRGMRERARLIGGTFRVASAAGRGTTIEVTARWKSRGDGGNPEKESSPRRHGDKE